MFDIITIGGATRDVFFEFKNLKKIKDKKSSFESYLLIPYGEKIVSDNTFYCYGGGSINTSVCFARLGLKTVSVCNIGKEGTGSLVRNFLKKEMVNTSLVRRDSTLHTGLSIFIMGQDGEHTGFLERGANSHLVIEKISKLKKTKWFYISSLTGESDRLLPEIFEFAARHNIKVAFNPGSKQLSSGYHGLKKYIEQTEVLLLNFEEAQELVFSRIKKHFKDEKVLLLEIKKMGAKISVVTEDGKGSLAVSKNGKHYYERAYSTHVIDTTGAGDSFGATFVFGIIKGYPINISLKMAAINAASVVSEFGATKGLLSYNRLKGSKWL